MSSNFLAITKNQNFDILIIGAGPGGYVAAIRAAQHGFSTAIVEKDKLGGICLNWGCIPTKALLRSAEVYHQMQHASEYGLECTNPSFSLEKIVARSRNISSQLNKGVETLMKKNKITVISGEATFSSSQPEKSTVNIKNNTNTSSTITARHIVIATGARPRQLPNLPIDHHRIWDYRDAMTPKSLPKSILVVGSGAIGMEFACFYATLGSKVTIVEIADRIMINEDKEISAMAEKSFTESGIKIYTSSSIEKINSDTAIIKNKNGEKIEVQCENIISAAGIVPNSQNLSLEKINVATDKGGYIIVDPMYQTTTHNNIYAIGDVAGTPCLAHKASHDALCCIDYIAYKEKILDHPPHPINKNNIPGCTYTHPQIASIGYTEEAALNAGYQICVGRFPLYANGKALAMGGGAHKGMVKTIYEKNTGEILGVHMIGAEVTEMIHSFSIAKNSELVAEDIISAIFPHPTISEAILESTLGAYSRSIHL